MTVHDNLLALIGVLILTGAALAQVSILVGISAFILGALVLIAALFVYPPRDDAHPSSD